MKDVVNNSSRGDIIVIGYGNDLRGDDAAGLRAATLVRQCQLPGVLTLLRQQLTPELVELISNARAVIFIDASLEVSGETAYSQPVAPANSANLLAHMGQPDALLAMAETIYGHCPPAWCIHVPARNFDLGAPLSAFTEHALASAVEQVKTLCGKLGSTTSTQHV